MLYALFPTLCIAQAPDTLWTKMYGRSGPDRAYAIQPAVDGGYIIVGTTFTPNPICNYDVYLLKIDDQGDTAWTKVLGGTYNDAGYAIQQTSDSGYIITGYTTVDISNENVYLVKTDVDGDTIWTRNYGGPEEDRGFSVQETSDGGYIIVGHMNVNYREDIYVIKTDMYGDTIWTREYGDQYENYGQSVLQMSDDGYSILGYTDVAFGCQEFAIWFLRTDSIGDTLWTRIYDPYYYDERGYDMQQTADGGYVITGCASVSGHLWDVLILKIDANGDTLWKRILGGSDYEFGYSVQETYEGGYVVTGSRRPSPGYYDLYMCKFDGLGNTIWIKTLGGTNDDESQAVIQTPDLGYLIVGYTESFGASNADVYIVRLAADPGGGIGNQETESKAVFVEASPNPFSHFTEIRYGIRDKSQRCELKIYDVSGRSVMQWDYQKIRLSDHVSWHGTDQAYRRLPSGVYFLKLTGQDYSMIEKLLLIR